MTSLPDQDVIQSLTDGITLSPSQMHALRNSLRELLVEACSAGLNCETKPSVTEDNARLKIDCFLKSISRYPAKRFSGRGIVICAGGIRMFRCAWVCINMLRRFGCQLPVEMWALNDSELTIQMKAMIEPLGVEVVNAALVRRRHPARILNAWELKPFALVHSRFEEVILLDSDNVPLIDPEVLFSRRAYSKLGSIFWPDAGRFAQDHPIWRICKLKYRNEPQFESGQIVVDKNRSWKALRLTTHLNDHSDFYYRYVHGDKDTFYLAWRILDQKFGMVPTPMKQLRGAMCQHDFNGRRIFQHRNFLKWDRESGSITGFRFEKHCRLLLAKLDRELE